MWQKWACHFWVWASWGIARFLSLSCDRQVNKSKLACWKVRDMWLVPFLPDRQLPNYSDVIVAILEQPATSWPPSSSKTHESSQAIPDRWEGSPNISIEFLKIINGGCFKPLSLSSLLYTKVNLIHQQIHHQEKGGKKGEVRERDFRVGGCHNGLLNLLIYKLSPLLYHQF